MEKAVLTKMRAAVKAGRLVLTEHAVDEMIADDLFEFDVEKVVVITTFLL